MWLDTFFLSFFLVAKQLYEPLMSVCMYVWDYECMSKTLIEIMKLLDLEEYCMILTSTESNNKGIATKWIYQVNANKQMQTSDCNQVNANKWI